MSVVRLILRRNKGERQQAPFPYTIYQSLYTPRLPAFTLMEIMVVIAIVSILFLIFEPTYSTFRVRSQLDNATDRTRQALERAKTLALSGYRTAGSQPDMFIVDIDGSKDPEHMITLCAKKFDPEKKVQPSDVSPCASNIIDSVALGQVFVRSPIVATRIAFVPPFGTSVTTVGPGVIDISLQIKGSTSSSGASTILFTPATNRVEVNPRPTP